MDLSQEHSLRKRIVIGLVIVAGLLLAIFWRARQRGAVVAEQDPVADAQDGAAADGGRGFGGPIPARPETLGLPAEGAVAPVSRRERPSQVFERSEEGSAALPAILETTPEGVQAECRGSLCRLSADAAMNEPDPLEWMEQPRLVAWMGAIEMTAPTRSPDGTVIQYTRYVAMRSEPSSSRFVAAALGFLRKQLQAARCSEGAYTVGATVDVNAEGRLALSLQCSAGEAICSCASQTTQMAEHILAATIPRLVEPAQLTDSIEVE